MLMRVNNKIWSNPNFSREQAVCISGPERPVLAYRVIAAVEAASATSLRRRSNQSKKA